MVVFERRFLAWSASLTKQKAKNEREMKKNETKILKKRNKRNKEEDKE